MFSKKLKHLADISPYKIMDTFPFSQWIHDDSQINQALIIIDTNLEKWHSLSSFISYILDRIYQFSSEEKLIPLIIDTKENQLYDKLELIVKNSKHVFVLGINSNFSQKLITLRENINFNLHYFWFASTNKMGIQLKALGLDLFRTNDTLYTLCEADSAILKKVFPDLNFLVYGINNFSIRIEPGKSLRKDLVYIGRLTPSKNIDKMLFMLHSLALEDKSDFQLHLYGELDNLNRTENSSYPNYKSFLKKLSIELGIENQVYFHGHKEREIIFREIPKNSIGLFLSSYNNENYGLAPREMLERGYPVILSNWGGLGELAARVNNPLIARAINFTKSKIIDMQDLKFAILEISQFNEKLSGELSEPPLSFGSDSNIKRKINTKKFYENMISTKEMKQEIFFKSYSKAEKKC